MKRNAASVVLVFVLATALGPGAHASDESSSAATETNASSDESVAIVMGPPVEQSVAGWREMGLEGV